MTYQAPIAETDHAKISVHNKAELAPGGHAWIVSDRQDRETLAFFRDGTLGELKDVFRAVSGLPDDGGRKFILFHAVNPKDTVQNTNSKLPSLHIHTFTGPFAAEFSHIANPSVKSYTVQPNAMLARTIADAALNHPEQDDGFMVITLDKDKGGEIQSHTILLHRGFSGFDDFAANAGNDHWDGFRNAMTGLIEPWVQSGMGGTRIVIDDRYTKTGFLTVQVLAGENMDRSGNNKQRYFEAPLCRP